MDIYISSLAFLGKPPEEVIQIAKTENLAIEFSSGMPYREDMEELYLNADVKKMPHNYFPAPQIPFVLNLASSNAVIRKKSIDHCIKGLHLSKQSGALFFSAHAGFCIDPDPAELGKKISYNPTFDKDEHKAIFLDSLKTILKEAENLDILFLIENNVIAPFNMHGQNQNPLLCCESEDIKWLFAQNTNNKLRLLLDTAHLKVSCNTLGLDICDELNKIEEYIFAFHHSDNDGTVDDNQPINNDYWFLPYMKTFSKYLHVIEVKKISVETIREQVKLLQQYGR